MPFLSINEENLAEHNLRHQVAPGVLATDGPVPEADGNDGCPHRYRPPHNACEATAFASALFRWRGLQR